MGSNIVRRLMRDGHSCVVFDLNPKAVAALEKEGARGAESIAELLARPSSPRAVWVMLPPGEVTGDTIEALASRIETGDMITDSGSSYCRDDIRRSADLSDQGIHLVDCGTSGGV